MRNWANYLDQAAQNLERLTKESPSVWEVLDTKESVLDKIAERLENEIEAWTMGKEMSGKEISDIYKTLEFVRKLKQRG